MNRKRAFVVAAAAGLAVSAGANAQIVNGGFETGDLTGWTITATNPSPVNDATTFHTGTHSALLGTNSGTEPLGDGAMYQQFAVPAGGAALSFWYKTFTTDSISFDWQDAYIQDSGGTTLATIFHVCQTADWTQAQVDLTPYAGQTIRIAFLVHQDGFGDDTSMNVDDVTLGPPPGQGACCTFSGSCSVTSSVACTSAGGTYRGDGSTCGTVTCPGVPPVIYSNCNLTTGTTTLSGVTAPAGSQWSEVARDATDATTANTNAGYAGSGAFRLADDFTVPTGGMTLGFVRIYAYLTGATTPGVTAATLAILDGPPGTGNVVFGDETTNRMANNSFAPIYRCFNTVAAPTCGGAATIPDQNRHQQYVYLTVNQFLPAGHYWIDYGYTGASFSPPTTSSTAIGRQCDPNNANAMQLNGTWAPITDLGQGCAPTAVTQDLFFDLLGTLGGGSTCYANCDHSTNIPFLNVNDFVCFQTQFASGASYANCDHSTTPPILNVNDFICFQTAFAAGCSAP